MKNNVGNPAKKIASASVFVTITLLALIIGFFSGLFYAAPSQGEKPSAIHQRQNELQRRTELYEPTCRDLKTRSHPRLIKNGNDYFLVSVRQDYFYVIGLDLDPAHSPLFAWWGAGLDNALKQSCGP
jgi:hypothetical protein